MAELIDPRPKFVIVMGCDGAGKSAWKRDNYDRLPEVYFDQDSLAGGMGDWDDDSARARTRLYVDAEVDRVFAAKLDFGIESTFSGRPGPALMDRAVGEGYQVEGYYMGTEGPEINARRIEERVLLRTGHRVDPERLPGRYRYSLSKLRKRLDQFDLLEVVDNTAETPDRIPDPVTQFVAEKGSVVEQLPEEQMAAWCRELLRRREEARRQAELRAARRAAPQ